MTKTTFTTLILQSQLAALAGLESAFRKHPKRRCPAIGPLVFDGRFESLQRIRQASYVFGTGRNLCRRPVERVTDRL